MHVHRSPILPVAFLALALGAAAVARATPDVLPKGSSSSKPTSVPSWPRTATPATRPPPTPPRRPPTRFGRTRAGGDSGPVIEPNKPAESLLISALKYESYEMPPDRQAARRRDSRLRKVDRDWRPRSARSNPARRGVNDGQSPIRPSQPWAFKRPQKYCRRPGSRACWRCSLGHRPLHFREARSEQVCSPSPSAAPRTLLRRVYYDLTGLPPTADELGPFAADPSDAEYEATVDRLLASPRFGERWGRHWLDVARYADTKGYVFQEDRNYPHGVQVSRLGDRRFNGDMPFDKFIVAQIAADQTGDPSAPRPPVFSRSAGGSSTSQHDINDDRIDLMTRGLMGLTVACARCHDHKYDAIPHGRLLLALRRARQLAEKRRATTGRRSWSTRRRRSTRRLPPRQRRLPRAGGRRRIPHVSHGRRRAATRSKRQRPAANSPRRSPVATTRSPPASGSTASGASSSAAARRHAQRLRRPRRSRRRIPNCSTGSP